MRSFLISSLVVLFGSGCAQLFGFEDVKLVDDGGGNDGGDLIDAGPVDEITKSLQGLGINVSPSPRIDNDGNDLPEDYAPFGTKSSLETTHEFMLFGAHLRDPANNNEINAPVIFFDMDNGPGSVLHQTSGPEPAFVDETNQNERFAQTTRAASAADLNGDGIDGALVVFVDLQDTTANMELRALSFASGTADTPFEEQGQLLKLIPNIVDINIAAGDFDGDGDDDLVVGVISGTTDNFAGNLHFFTNNAGSFAEDTGATVTFSPVLTTAQMSMRIVIGNLDHDRNLETAIVLNEHVGTFDANGTTRYFVYDDKLRGFSLLSDGPISVIDNGTFPASVADLAIGDIDGDNLGELIFGGLSGFKRNCEIQNMIGLALDDAVHGFAIVGQIQRDFFPSCEEFDPVELTFLEVHAVDLDGDSIDEIVIHGFVFDNFSNAAPWTLTSTIPDSAYIDNSGGYLDRNTISTVIGDANGDGREDIVIFSQAEGIAAYGTDAVSGFGLRKTIGTRIENTQSPLHAVFIALNTDADSVVLGIQPQDTKATHTKAIVLAAIAAPPCYQEFGQTDRCVTTFGSETASSEEIDQVVSITASSATDYLGFTAVSQNEITFRQTISDFASRVTGSGYTLKQPVGYKTGAQEDSVIFASVPFDHYVYKVLSHPDASIVGKTLAIALPRSPIHLMVERDFFNQNLPEQDPPIADNVFAHIVGDVASYMSLTEMQTLRADVGGLEAPVKTVGQGGGSTEISLAIGNALSTGQPLEMSFTKDIRATNDNVVHGFSAGADVANTLRITSGDLSNHTSSIGNLTAEEFSENQYRYGLFTYVFEDTVTEQEFEVINYWIE